MHVASLDGIMVKLLSIMLGTCGTLGLDLRGCVIAVTSTVVGLVVVDVVLVVVIVDVTVVVGTVAVTVTFDFFSLDNI